MHSRSIHNTAILVFARSSKVEVTHKSIYNGRLLFDALTTHVLETTAKTQLPYFHFSEEKQVGNTFGERFTNAVKDVFEKGYDQVITIGNDTPQLKASHILTAEKQLRLGKTVIGPSTDGGFYLLGVHKSNFDPKSFQQLAWQTNLLSKQLLQLFRQRDSSVFQLVVLKDLDSEADVRSIVAFSRQFSKELIIAFLSTMGLSKNKYSLPSRKLRRPTLEINQNKGSPLLLSF